MKRTLTSFLLITLATTFSPTLKAQNLVPNPSFEIYSACPNGLSLIYKAVGWYNARPTPDYFNACAPFNSLAGVPLNNWGYQYAATGNAYAGFAAFNGGTINDGREVLGAYLNSPLQIGVKYYVSFKVNLFDWNGNNLGPICPCNKLGVLFTTKAFTDTSNWSTDSTNWAPICNCSQIYSDSVITDTMNWVTIKGSFMADSAYTFISVGNFFVDSLTDVLFQSPSCQAYYYVDDICVSTDSLYCFDYIYSGINENKERDSFTFYPNPAHNQIEINGNEIQSLTLYDVLGRVIYLSKQEIISPLTINTTSFSRGIYFLRAGTKGGGVVVRKVVVE